MRPVGRLAIVSFHTSPLAQPGIGDGGGMNVYVDSLARGLARAGVNCEVLTRVEAPGQAPIVEVEPGYVVRHLPAGPRARVPKEDLLGLVPEFTDRIVELYRDDRLRPDLLHGNYWLSGLASHRAKHELDLPMVATFHTLARVKAETAASDEPELRARGEAEIVRCSDLILASTAEEVDQLASLYDADRRRIEIVAPGVDHHVFRPGDRGAAKAALGVSGHNVLLFVGRIQPLKGLELAVRSFARIAAGDPTALLVVIGGPSGSDGPAELARAQAVIAEHRLEARVQFHPPQLHPRLVTWYRAADVCLVPSRAESFGLVALEAAACGTPVVAAAVGGLRSIIHDGVTGVLVDGRDPSDFAAPIERLLRDPGERADMGLAASAASLRYSWDMTAVRLRRLYADVIARTPVRCL
jgi:D-inositol-3-phosphate glycosyltransferase